VDESSVEIGEAEERLNILDFSRLRPILDDLDFIFGHFDTMFVDNVSEIFHFVLVEFAFVTTGIKSMLAKSFKDFDDMSFVFFGGVGVHKDVVEIDEDRDVEHVCEDVIHEPLKGSGRV
jgi:hypothetical protein